MNLKSPNKLPALCVNGNEERSAGCRNMKLAKYATKVAENRNREKTKKRKFQEKYYLQSKSLMLHPPLKSLMHNFISPSDLFPLDPQHITAYMVNCKTCAPGKYIGHREKDSSFRPTMWELHHCLHAHKLINFLFFSDFKLRNFSSVNNIQ